MTFTSPTEPRKNSKSVETRTKLYNLLGTLSEHTLNTLCRYPLTTLLAINTLAAIEIGYDRWTLYK
jgi:hypothetical protein